MALTEEKFGRSILRESGRVALQWLARNTGRALRKKLANHPINSESMANKPQEGPSDIGPSSGGLDPSIPESRLSPAKPVGGIISAGSARPRRKCGRV